jgi:serine protease AprX
MPRPQILSLPERLDAHPGYRGKGICMAFVDMGFYPHPDLNHPARRIRGYADVTRSTPDPDDYFYPQPLSWHGTMTACVAAGNGYLSGGRYRGLASESEVVLLRIASAERRITGKHVASAIRFPIRYPEMNIRVLNLSLGVNPDDPDAADVIEATREATEQGVVVFAAAGNDVYREPEPPATSPHVITVGGVNDQNTADPDAYVPWPSSYARGQRGPQKPDLLAPAIWLPAPMLPGTITSREARPLFDLLVLLEELASEQRLEQERRGLSVTSSPIALAALEKAVDARIDAQKFISPEYQHVDGTSFAAPIAASVAAQMLEANPALTPSQIKKGLLATAIPLAGLAPERQGAGVLQARAAVEWALERVERAIDRTSGLPIR